MSSDVASTIALARLNEQIVRMEKWIPSKEEIYQKTFVLCDLRAKRNSLLPVFRLPPETLVIIFIHGACDYYESASRGYFTRLLPTWINVSYVCSYWRNIALNCPTLWTYHLNLSLRWTQELLLRSKEAPLKISWICPSYRCKGVPRLPRLLDNWLKHSGRIQELCLDVPPSYLPEKLSLCIPHIETLELSVKPTVTRFFEIADGDKLPLRILKLVNCSLPWYSLNLSGLTTLSLCLVSSPSPPNMVELLAILSRMQGLTALRLEFVLPSARDFLSGGGLNSSPKINLPCLSLLEVSAPLSTVVAFISCVSIPLSTRLNLGLIFESGSSIGEYSPISSFIAQQLKASGLTFCSVSLCTIDVPSLMLGLDRNCPYLFKDVDHDIPLKIMLREDPDERLTLRPSDAHRILSDICLSLPLENIQILYVYQNPRCEFPITSEIWREILGCLDGLQSMKLCFGFMPDLSFLSLVAHESDENLGAQPIADQGLALRHTFVPALEEMELKSIEFMHGQDRMSQESLLDVISTRKGLKDRVTMITCTSS